MSWCRPLGPDIRSRHRDNLKQPGKRHSRERAFEHNNTADHFLESLKPRVLLVFLLLTKQLVEHREHAFFSYHAELMLQKKTNVVFDRAPWYFVEDEVLRHWANVFCLSKQLKNRSDVGFSLTLVQRVNHHNTRHGLRSSLLYP
ncbi:hypothetical protein DDE82_008799 [Stemphylium lycopersici]|nr:hypothetical protein TW65_07398 [Stemphylium lycopersici]RAQ98898.1 hypothetical protein DDE82_008799 [Stemphylium lycopersici]